MGNEKIVISGNTKTINLKSAQYGKETRIARGKLKVSFSRVFGIIEFLLIKINQNY